MLGSYISYQINLWQRKTVFMAGLVQVSKINAHPLFSTLFRGDDDVGQPFWIMGFFDNTCLDEFRPLFIYDLQLVWRELFSFLIDRRMIRFGKKLMNGNLRIYFWDIALRPCIYIILFSSKILRKHSITPQLIQSRSLHGNLDN